MGFRLNIAKEPPTLDNHRLYIFDKEYMISEGGAWELDIFKIINDDTETVNITKQRCETYPNCIMCDCSDDSWFKISIEDLIGKEKYLKNNINIENAFILDYETNWENYKNKEQCSYEFIVNKPHREYIWINIS